ncbi:MAG TPA: hypothetical protein PKD15_01190 [Candidatus Saccharibacteria bacterium]|jgi:hypothetical protein|nr:hypothetical protein [Candidatus Saccharibacteria bacterium]
MKQFMILATALLSLLLPLGGVAAAQFDTVIPNVCNGKTSDSATCTEIDQGASGTNPVTSTGQNVANLLSAAVGVAAVIVIIVAGVNMTMSQGDSGKVKASRDAIIYAAVGLVVVALSRTIVYFVVNRTR